MTQPSKDEPNQQQDLLGYALGLLDESERAAVEAAFANRAELDLAVQRVRHVLRPLDVDRAEAPADLSSRILARVDALHRTIPLTAGKSLAPTDGGANTDRGSSFSSRDLIGLAAAILIFVGIFVPGYQSARRATQRTICANNLRQIGYGAVQYAEANANQFPLTAGLPVDAAWAAGAAKSQPEFRHVSSSRQLFPLVQQGYVEPQQFVCEARPGEIPMTREQAAGRNDFPNVRNNSYSTPILPQQWTRLELDPSMPIASDLTPLVNDDRALVDGAAPENSTSHPWMKGQNVLRANISVIWSPNPRVGLDNDDIYRVMGVNRYTGTERPSNRTDAFLIP